VESQPALPGDALGVTARKENIVMMKTFKTHVDMNGTKRMFMGLVLGVAVMFPYLHATAAQAPVDLRSTSRFAILAGSGITSVPTSDIRGDVGLSPAARSTISGLTPVEVVGTIFAADDGGAVADMLTTAKGDLTTAYNDAAGRTPVPTGPFLNPGSGNLGGLNLVPGLYKFTGEALISGSDLTLTGNASDVWIFQIGSLLTVADGIHVVLAGGAEAANIYWQVGTSATLGTTTIFKGNILADQSISLATGATLDGRAMARIGAVTLDSNPITIPNAVTGLVILVSAAEATGPYTDAPGQSVDTAAKTITVPMSGDMQYYRITSDTALTIASITIYFGSVVITYN